MASFEGHVEPIKLGYLSDITMPKNYPEDRKKDQFQPFELVFKEGYEKGLIDRPIEIIYRECEGLPKGSFKAVVDAFAELVEAGCIAIFGPFVSDSAVPMREIIEERFKVPAITAAGAEEWMGEWTFGMPAGSMADEPAMWARLIAKRGLKTVGAVIEQSLIGELYMKRFRECCVEEGIAVVGEETIPQTGQVVTAQIGRLYELKPEALVHCGFGFGLRHVNDALAPLNWDPPRFCGTAFQLAWISPEMWNALLGWIGLDQYDEGNMVGQAFLDKFQAAYGRRPEFCSPVVKRDIATVLLHGFAGARPLTPRGMKESLERVKSIPAAAGAPGTRLAFGNWMRRGWQGSAYLVARRLDPDGKTSYLVDRSILID